MFKKAAILSGILLVFYNANFFSSLNLFSSNIPFPIPGIQVDSFGKANSQIPIQLPPGRGGLIPNLSLVYNSANQKQNMFGVGWGLSGIEYISRDSSYGVHNSSQDHFFSTMAGGGHLVALADGTYHSIKENFVRFVPNGQCGNGPCYWIATDRNGTTYTFGKTSQSRFQVFTTPISTVVGSQGDTISTWVLDSVRDIHGTNGYDIEYQTLYAEYNDTYVLARGAVPKKISYNDGQIQVLFNVATNGGLSTGTNRSVNVLEDSSKLVKSISVQVLGSTTWSYFFSYDVAGLGGRSRLVEVERDGFDPLSITYSSKDISNATYTANNSQLTSLSSNDLETPLTYRYPKYDGDEAGVCNLMDQACICTALGPIGSNACVGANPIYTAIVLYICGSYASKFADFCANGTEGYMGFYEDVTGDGVIDFVRVNGLENSNYLTVTPFAGPDVNSSTSYSNLQFAMTKRSRILTGDINGDLITDLLVFEDNGTLGKIFKSVKGGGFQVTTSTVKANIPEPEGSILQKEYNFLVDMNSDQRADFVTSDGNNFYIYYALTNSVGFSSSKVTIPVPAIPGATIGFFGVDFQKFIDLDHNGVPDFIRLDGGMSLVVSYFDRKMNVIETTVSVLHNLQSTAPNRFFAEINGDNNLDFVTLTSDGMSYFENIGGTFVYSQSGYSNISYSGARVIIQENPGFSSSYVASETQFSIQGFKFTMSLNDTQTVFVNFTNGVKALVTLPPSASPATSDVNKDGCNDGLTIVDDGVGDYYLHIYFGYFNDSGDPNCTLQGDYATVIPESAFSPTVAGGEADSESLATMSQNLYDDWRLGRDFADVDLDGRDDFIWYDGSKIHISLNRDNGQTYTVPAEAFQVARDLNRDGTPDFVGITAKELNVQTTIPNAIGTTVRYNNCGFTAGPVSSPSSIAFYQAPVSVSGDLLSSFSNTASQSVNVSYQIPLLTGASVYKFSANGFYGNLAPDHVVSEVLANLSSGIAYDLQYTYTGGMIYLGNLDLAGLAGFQSIAVKSVTTNRREETDFVQNDPYLIGLPQEKRSYIYSSNSDTILGKSNFTYSETLPFNSFQGIGPTFIYASTISNIEYQKGVPLQTSQKTDQFDSYGNLTDSSVVVDGNDTISSSKSYFPIDSQNWVLGLLKQSQKKTNGSVVRNLLLSYHSGTSDIETLSNQIDTSGNFTTINFLQYDTYGNVLSVQDANGNISNIAYDSAMNQYPAQIKNALGFTVTKTYDYKFGVPIGIVDENGGATSKTYDDYGRVSTVTFPNSSQANIRYTYDNTGIFQSGQQQSITKEVYDSLNDEYMSATEYYDPMGRAVRKEKPMGSNILQITRSAYDLSGKLSYRTKPFLQGLDSQEYTESFSYDDPDGQLSSVTHPDGSVTNISYSGNIVNSITTLLDSSTRSVSTNRNSLGQTTSRTVEGKTILYTYDPAGNIRTIQDPNGSLTTITYDLRGKKTQVQTPNSGITKYTYDANGNLLSQKDANSNQIQNQYDALNRIVQTDSASGTISYVYDASSGSSYSVNRLSQVTDSTGTTEYEYDILGNVTKLIKTVDGITFVSSQEYDSLQRPTKMIYPDGTKVYNEFSEGGQLAEITMDTADGSSTGYPVVTYSEPYVDSQGNPAVKKTSGNGVETIVSYDPLYRRATNIVTTTASAAVAESWSYGYDASGNISSIQDNVTPTRNQVFEYDQWSRLTKATGKYGTENYSYSDSGNLLTKGDYTYTYGSGSHVNAVTTVTSSNTGTMTYSYDAVGNMIYRNGDTLSYDAFGRLVEVDLYGGGTLEYEYDFAGERVKVENQTNSTITYKLGETYQISQIPSQSDRHTLYIRGAGGEVVSQITRTDAVLLTSVTNTKYAGWPLLAGICSTVAIDCDTYLKNRAIDFFEKYTTESPLGKYLGFVGYTRLLFLALLILGSYGIYFHYQEMNSLLKRIPFVSGLPMILVSTLFVFIFNGCGLLPGGGGKSGTAPWLLVPSGVNSDTPSVPDPGNGGSPEIGGTPSTGMFFYHQNLLGSTDMLTDGTGNVTTGAGQEGASHVSYKPYGEIDRADSSGPDIFSYKYTGQIEDTPTELYYYKSRYYDPVLGRFIQPDSIVEPGNLFGMNQYMYVNGNPINYNDPTGNSSEIIHEINKWIRDTIHSFNHLGGEHHSTAFFPQMSDYVNGQVGQTTKWNTTQWAIMIGIAVASYFTVDAAGGIAEAIIEEEGGGFGATVGVLGLTGVAGSLVTQLGGYLIGRGAGGFDKANIHQSGWDSEHANAYGPMGLQSAIFGGTLASLYSAYDELFEKAADKIVDYEADAKNGYYIMTREMAGNQSYYAIAALQKTLLPAYKLGIIAGKILIVSKFVFNIAYEHVIDMSLDKIKESQRWGEAPEHESFAEEQAKEFLLDKLRESASE